MKTEKLLFGAAYYSEYLPYDRVDEDMAMMEKAGMNVIRIAESTWSTLEPQDGIFDFTHLDRMLASAKKHNLSVIIGTPTYAIPTWLSHKYPDILAFTHNGQEIYGHRQNMDITHPEYLILDEPTRGIDIGTKIDIQKLVLKLASEGMSITFISSETDEMLRTCSRLVVMRDRKVVGELSGEDLTQNMIMNTIAGGDRE